MAEDTNNLQNTPMVKEVATIFTEKVDKFSGGEKPAIYGDERAQFQALTAIEQGMRQPAPEGMVDSMVDAQIELAQTRAEIMELEKADLLGDLGVFSRRAFDLRLQNVAKRMQKGNLDDVSGFAIVVLDMDGLGLINDKGGFNVGHEMGDAALRNVAISTISSVRLATHDEIVRTGGDELAVFMEMGDSKQAIRILESGTEGRVGVLDTIQENMRNGVDDLRARYGERWPESAGGVEPGMVSIGWDYLDRESLIKMYEDFVREGPGDGDFMTRVIDRADKDMLASKKNKRL